MDNGKMISRDYGYSELTYTAPMSWQVWLFANDLGTRATDLLKVPHDDKTMVCVSGDVEIDGSPRDPGNAILVIDSRLKLTSLKGQVTYDLADLPVALQDHLTKVIEDNFDWIEWYSRVNDGWDPY